MDNRLVWTKTGTLGCYALRDTSHHYTTIAFVYPPGEVVEDDGTSNKDYVVFVWNKSQSVWNHQGEWPILEEAKTAALALALLGD